MRSSRSVLFFLTIIVLVAAVSSASAQEIKPVKSILLPEGTTVTKTTDGFMLLSLPDGCKIRIKDLPKGPGPAGSIGDPGAVEDVSIRDDSGKIVAVGKTGRIIGAVKGDPKPAAGKWLVMEGVSVHLPARLEIVQPRIFNRTAFLRMTQAAGRE